VVSHTLTSSATQWRSLSYIIWVSALEAERNGECQSGPDFIDGVAVGQRVAKSDVEGELVADLPDQADKPGNGLLETEFLLIKHLCDRPYLPFRWAFDNAADENIGVVVSRQCGFRVEVSRSLIPALGNNAGPADANAAVSGAVRQEHPEFGRDAWPGFVLKAAGHYNVLEECACVDQLC
jgi:hypothetical protein